MRARKRAVAGTAVGVSGGAVAVFSLVLLTCCSQQRVDLGPAHRLPSPDQLVIPDLAAVHASADSITRVAMRNVLFHVDDDVRLGIRTLQGRARDARGGQVVNLDDRTALQIEMASAEVGLTARDLSIVLNRYIFGYKGSPLKDIVVRTEGDHIVQTGTMHKIIDIPFEMTATLSVTPDGWIRIHPTRMEICNLDGQKLLQAVGRSLEDLLDVRGAKGVRVVGNDLMLDPLVSIPPPKIAGRLTAIRVEGGEVVQTFGSSAAADAAPIAPPVTAKNYVYFRGGSLRFGKLYMVESDLTTVDADDSDPFDFYLDYYHTQLVAGNHITLPNYGLVAYMPDFDDVGTPKGIVARPAVRR